MELLLVRHGIAAERDVSEWPDDSARPLTEDGAERFRRAARGLGRLVPKVDRLLTSDYARASQTAAILSDEVGWPAAEPLEELRPGASLERFLDVLVPLAGAEAVALVGHEPELSELASSLVTGDDAMAIELKKGGVISLGIDGTPTPGTAVLFWAIPPRVLREI